MSHKLSRQGYDDAACNNGFNEKHEGNYSYTEGYRLGLESMLRWAEDDLDLFNKNNPTPVSKEAQPI